MKIGSNDISFKSHIIVASPKKYNIFVDKLVKNPKCEYIYEWRLLGHKFINNVKKGPFRINVNQVITEGIRSCTAGFIVDKGKSTLPLAFHLYDDEENLAKVQSLNKYITGSNAFLIGARSKYKESIPLFNKLEKMLKSKKIPTTIMKDFKAFWEADIAYDSFSDNIYLCIKDIMNHSKYINDFPSLKKVFNKFELSPKDTLEFVE